MKSVSDSMKLSMVAGAGRAATCSVAAAAVAADRALGAEPSVVQANSRAVAAVVAKADKSAFVMLKSLPDATCRPELWSSRP